MRKMIALILVMICASSLGGCNRKADFEDFAEYENDFNSVVQFVLEYQFQGNDVSTLILDTNGYIKMGDAPISDDTLTSAVKRIREKGFTSIDVGEDYMIFWEDETGYYGVLWSDNPAEAINRATKSHPYMKSRELAKEWYEVGALDSI